MLFEILVVYGHSAGKKIGKLQPLSVSEWQRDGTGHFPGKLSPGFESQHPILPLERSQE